MSYTLGMADDIRGMRMSMAQYKNTDIIVNLVVERQLINNPVFIHLYPHDSK